MIFLAGLLVLRIATTLCCVGCPKILHFWPNISYWPNLHPLELNVLKKRRGKLLKLAKSGQKKEPKLNKQNISNWPNLHHTA